jgi:NADPH-dependent 2,4-dienoyl-CoA reductase/sulfur reductase-like enzyme
MEAVMMNINTEILIVGGGPAGIQAARLIKAESPDTKVSMLRPEDNSVIYCAIPYVIEGLMDIERIKKRDQLVTGVGVELIRQRAVEADFDKKKVFLEDKSVVNYEKLLIVTGAVPVKPPVQGIDLENVWTVKNIKDTERIVKALGPCDGKAVVIGAGAIGIEQALAYRARGLKVYLVDMADRPLPNMLDKDFSEHVENELRSEDINLMFNTTLSRIEGKKYAEKVIFSDGKVIELEPGRDFVIVAVGMRPDIDVFKNAGIKTGKTGIVVDESMKTSVEDVFACGDCVEYISVIDKKVLGGKLATNAVPMAKVMAKNVLGKKSSYKGFVNGAVTVAGKKRFGGTGFTEDVAKARGFEIVKGYGESTSRFPIMPGAEPVHVKIIADKKNLRIIGGQIVGTEAVAEKIDIISFAIQNSMKVEDLMEFSYSAQPWQTFFPAKNAIVEACENIMKEIK